MPRLPRFCPANHATHVVQRGTNRQVCFTCDDDMAAYAHSLREGATKYVVAVHAWAFMPNHVHILMTVNTDPGVSQLMKLAQSLSSEVVQKIRKSPNTVLVPDAGAFRDQVNAFHS